MEKHKTIGKSMPDLFKDVKPVQHSKVKADSRIHNSSQTKRKVIQIYRNGEEYSRPVTVLLTHFEQQNMEIVLRSIGERVLFNDHRAVRRLYSMEGKLVKNVDEMEDGKSYVAAGKENFILLKYGTRTATLILGGKKDYDDVRLFKVPPGGPVNRSSTTSAKMQRSVTENDESRTRRAKSQDRLQTTPRKPTTPTPAKQSSAQAKSSSTTANGKSGPNTVKSLKSSTSTKQTSNSSGKPNNAGNQKQTTQAAKPQAQKKASSRHDLATEDIEVKEESRQKNSSTKVTVPRQPETQVPEQNVEHMKNHTPNDSSHQPEEEHQEEVEQKAEENGTELENTEPVEEETEEVTHEMVLAEIAAQETNEVEQKAEENGTELENTEPVEDETEEVTHEMVLAEIAAQEATETVEEMLETEVTEEQKEDIENVENEQEEVSPVDEPVNDDIPNEDLDNDMVMEEEIVNEEEAEENY